MDYSPLLRAALRAIRLAANVRFGILPSQSGFRRNDELDTTPSNPPLQGRAKSENGFPAFAGMTNLTSAGIAARASAPKHDIQRNQCRHQHQNRQWQSDAKKIARPIATRSGHDE